MGSFLGGSTICLAAGLRDRQFDRRVIHSYDLFRIEPSESAAQRRFFPDALPAGNNSRPIFEQHLRDYLDLIAIHEGDVLTFGPIGEPIELLFIDIAKSYKVMDHLLLNFFPALIPSRSLVILQDYLSPQTGPWHHIVMEKLSDYCEYIYDLNAASTAFLLKREISRSFLEQCLWMNIPMDEKLQLMQKAIDRLDTDEKRAYLISNRQILLDGRDQVWGMHYHSL
jgi:hypothetical protein